MSVSKSLSSVSSVVKPAVMQALGHALTDRRLQVLREIDACGSISQAARAVGISYKAAWQAIDTLSNLAGVPVVQKSVGGAGGGGARLTQAGHELLRAAQAMAQARGAVMQQLQAMDAAPMPTVQRLGIQISMRNQWPCEVMAVEIVGALAQVRLQAGGVLELLCRITAESAELLGLHAGMQVLAMCKATAVQVRAATAAPTVAPAATQAGSMNCWPAKAVRVAAGALGDEVAAQLEGGLQMVGFASAQSGLRAGRRLWLEVPVSAVVLAVV